MHSKPTRTLIRLGAARRQTQADQEKGVLEEIPIHMFRTVGWTN